jgi:hypothetical protein
MKVGRRSTGWGRDSRPRSSPFDVRAVSRLEMAGELSGRHWAATDAVIRAIAPFGIVNTYGLFAVMTTSRPEVIIEGSRDGMTWLPYEFKFKAGKLTLARPGFEPHQPRLDWQMWFAALGNYRADPWILHFLERLLEGSPQVPELLGPIRFRMRLRATYERRYMNTASPRRKSAKPRASGGIGSGKAFTCPRCRSAD